MRLLVVVSCLIFTVFSLQAEVAEICHNYDDVASRSYIVGDVIPLTGSYAGKSASLQSGYYNNSWIWMFAVTIEIDGVKGNYLLMHEQTDLESVGTERDFYFLDLDRPTGSPDSLDAWVSCNYYYGTSSVGVGVLDDIYSNPAVKAFGGYADAVEGGFVAKWESETSMIREWASFHGLDGNKVSDYKREVYDVYKPALEAIKNEARSKLNL